MQATTLDLPALVKPAFGYARNLAARSMLKKGGEGLTRLGDESIHTEMFYNMFPSLALPFCLDRRTHVQYLEPGFTQLRWITGLNKTARISDYRFSIPYLGRDTQQTA